MNILIVDDEVTALRDLARVLRDAAPEATVETADGAKKALASCRKQAFDVAFLDITMPDKDGLTLAKELKQLCPLLNIVMVTAYPQYALDAMRLYVSDYILKPARRDEVRRALANLRNPIRKERKGLFVQCFGSFEVFYDGEAVKFGRSKAKELFAYLIDRCGASASNAELRAVLWRDEANDSEKQRKYFALIVHELRSRLEALGCDDVFVQRRDSYAVVPDRIPCDYYLALERDAQASGRYRGEYMSQYAWAEMRVGVLNNELSAEEEKKLEF